jgi:hypothetical protein
LAKHDLSDRSRARVGAVRQVIDADPVLPGVGVAPVNPLVLRVFGHP